MEPVSREAEFGEENESELEFVPKNESDAESGDRAGKRTWTNKRKRNRENATGTGTGNGIVGGDKSGKRKRGEN